MQTFTVYNHVNIDLIRVNALATLVTGLKKQNVELAKVTFFQNGFQVRFVDLPGDAIIHDNSYGKDWGYWETFEMPWDHGDVSTHDPETLAKLLGALKRGEDWEQYE